MGFTEGNFVLKASFPGVITRSLFISLAVSSIDWNMCEISILCHSFKEKKGKERKDKEKKEKKIYCQILTRLLIRTNEGSSLMLIIPASLVVLVFISDSLISFNNHCKFFNSF